MKSLRDRNEWKFFAALPKADAPLAFIWWTIIILRGVLPALFAIAMGSLIGAVQGGDPLAVPLSLIGSVFVLTQVLTPIQTMVSANLGDRTAAWLYDRLTDACVRPPGMGHLENLLAELAYRDSWCEDNRHNPNIPAGAHVEAELSRWRGERRHPHTCARTAARGTRLRRTG